MKAPTNRIPPLALAALLLTGCNAIPGFSPAACPTPAVATGASVKGTVRAPADASGKPGTPIAPVSAAEVALTDGAGEPLPNTYHARTDAAGGFEVAGVPPGYAFAVEANVPGPDGQEVALSTLARPSTGGAANADIDPATTLVTRAVTAGRSGPVGDYDEATYKAAVARVAEKLKTEPLSALADPAATNAMVKAWADADPILATQLATLTKSVANGPAPASVQTEVARTTAPNPLDALSPIY